MVNEEWPDSPAMNLEVSDAFAGLSRKGGPWPRGNGFAPACDFRLQHVPDLFPHCKIVATLIISPRIGEWAPSGALFGPVQISAASGGDSSLPTAFVLLFANNCFWRERKNALAG